MNEEDIKTLNECFEDEMKVKEAWMNQGELNIPKKDRIWIRRIDKLERLDEVEKQHNDYLDAFIVPQSISRNDLINGECITEKDLIGYGGATMIRPYAGIFKIEISNRDIINQKKIQEQENMIFQQLGCDLSGNIIEDIAKEMLNKKFGKDGCIEKQ